VGGDSNHCRWFLFSMIVLRVPSHNNAWAQLVAHSSLIVTHFYHNLMPHLQQISACKMQLDLTYTCVCTVDTGRSQFTIRNPRMWKGSYSLVLLGSGQTAMGRLGDTIGIDPIMIRFFLLNRFLRK